MTFLGCNGETVFSRSEPREKRLSTQLTALTTLLGNSAELAALLIRQFSQRVLLSPIASFINVSSMSLLVQRKIGMDECRRTGRVVRWSIHPPPQTIKRLFKPLAAILPLNLRCKSV